MTSAARSAAALVLLTACAQYRTYPLLGLDPPGPAPIEPSGIAVLEDGRVITVAEGDADALLAPEPDRVDATGSALTIFPLTDSRDGCEGAGCRGRAYRAGVRLRREPIRWLPRERRVTTPYNVEDLAPFGPDRVLGVTEYTTIGRRTGYRKDYVARPRRQTERLFVLQRTVDGWQEVELPEVEQLRGLLSDWGRASCDGDMLVEGLAWDPTAERVYIGLNRCDGPVMRVLGWGLGNARRGLVADLEVVADGLAGGPPQGPAEGVSGLTWANGRLWAVSAWDSYGYEVEPAFGGRMHEVRDGRLHPVDLPGPFVDRPSALAILPSETPGDRLDAVVLFDNDADARARPEITVIQARTPRPAGGRFAELIDLTPVPEPLPLALNGFDFRWWIRDHRLGHLAAVLGERPSPAGFVTGAWTRALGGLWQMRVGASIGMAARWVPGAPPVGHNKQAVAFTDYSGTNLRFTRYRARVSVVPRDRARGDRTIADMFAERTRWRVTAPLRAPAPGGALVLQGFEIDTSSRADRGICLAAMDLGVSWHDDARDTVDLQATLVGGLCNDFDARGPDYFHGLTTAVDGGVLVTLHFAVVEGAPSQAWSVGVFDKSPPVGPEPGLAGQLDDDASRAHLHCLRVSPEGTVEPRPRQPHAPPASWLSQGMALEGTPAAGPVSLSGFAFALDPAGFDPVRGQRALTEEELLARNNYIYRYLLRALPDTFGTFIEGGMTHGIHLGGPMQDNARPSALALRAELTSFPGLDGAVAHDIVYPRRRDDPNLLPEDGYVRWSVARPADPEPPCSPSW